MNKTHFMGLLLATLLLSVQPLFACNSSVTSTAPASRYTDNLDGTVTDNVTGLMWKQCSEGQSGAACDAGGAATNWYWQGALALAQLVNTVNVTGFAGYADWRLPNRNELASLVENKCFDPAINRTAFPNTLAYGYWSASPHGGSPDKAWYVNFDEGYVHFGSKTNLFYLRVVRGGR